VSDWAANNAFRLQSRRGDMVSYTNNSQLRFVLEKDSRSVEINGINVAMSYPAALEKGVMYVTQFDFAKTFDPLIDLPSGKTIKTICLDPGHGGTDTGKLLGSQSEKKYTLLLAQELSSQLKAAGFNVFLTRTKDAAVELDARPDIANRKHADLFVSLHFNAAVSSKSEVSGIETYCITPVGASSSNAEGKGAGYGATPANAMEKKSLLLAYLVHKALVKNLGAEDRSVRRARFAVLREAEMPAILVEGGYMTHPAESKKIYDAAYRKQMAGAIVKGIQNYQRLTAAASATAPPVTKKKTSTPATRR
jgi:N-acetylmuramoyl-L-alanine amidase